MLCSLETQCHRGGDDSNPSYTVRKIMLLQLKDLRKDKSVLALHLPLERYSSCKVAVLEIYLPLRAGIC